MSEQHDEWQVYKRYFSAGSLAKLDRRLTSGEEWSRMGLLHT